MSVAMPAQKSGPGSTVSIFGRKISWDALLVAGAGLLGVVLLYRVGQPSSGAVPGGSQSSDLASGGGDSSGLSTTQVMPASTAPVPYGSLGAFSNYGVSSPAPSGDSSSPTAAKSGTASALGPAPSSSIYFGPAAGYSVAAAQASVSTVAGQINTLLAPGGSFGAVGSGYKPPTSSSAPASSGPAPYSTQVQTVTPKAGATHF